MNSSSARCSFCKTDSEYWHDESQRELYGFNCPNCRLFFISRSLHEKIKDRPIDNTVLWCICENIKTNRGTPPVMTSWHSVHENELPSLAGEITVKRFEHFENLPMLHWEKLDGLLLGIADKIGLQGPFKSIRLSPADLYRQKISGTGEAYHWLSFLIEKRLIAAPELKAMREVSNLDPSTQKIEHFGISITPAGWERIAKLNDGSASNKVFIATQFAWPSDDKALQPLAVEAIKSACRERGYEAELVSDPHHVDQITDRIIGGIRQSKFVVADFTYNNRGVYYEAGFARALGRTVFHTVKRGHTSDAKDEARRLHFDIRQINYVEWGSPDDLRTQLSDRIGGVVGNYVRS